MSQSMRDYMLKYRIPLSFPQFGNSDKVLLIRHAISQKNVKSAQNKSGAAPNKKHWREEIWAQNKLIDGPLHQIGVLQSEVLQKFLKQFKIRAVLVSPLRRAIQTMKIALANHPCCENFEIIIEPKLREVLDIPNDIPSFSLSYFQKLKEQLAEKGIKLNLSKLKLSSEPNAASIDTFLSQQGKSDRQQFLEMIKKEQLQGDAITARYIDFIIEKSQKKFEFRYEDSISSKMRAKVFKQQLNNTLQKLQLKQGQKVILISHCAMIKRLSAQSFNEETHDPINYKRLKNGEIFSLDIQQS